MTEPDKLKQMKTDKPENEKTQRKQSNRRWGNQKKQKDLSQEAESRKNRHHKTETKRRKRCRNLHCFSFTQQKGADSQNNSITDLFSGIRRIPRRELGQGASPVFRTHEADAYMLWSSNLEGTVYYGRRWFCNILKILKQRRMPDFDLYVQDFLEAL